MSTVPSREPPSRVAWVGRRAHRPATAAAAVAGSAVVFTAAWLGLGFLDGVDGAGLVLALFLAPVANAYVVAWLVWRWFVPRTAWSYARGAVTGLAIGVFAHATIGFAWALVALVAGSGSMDAGDILGVGVTYSLYSVPLTFGVPIASSVAVALGLTYCRRRVAGGGPHARK